jgi:hypothetical protein
MMKTEVPTNGELPISKGEEPAPEVAQMSSFHCEVEHACQLC